MACVDLPALPLQILLRAHPTWSARPAAVVERDAPHAALLFVNERARRAGVAAGMRYAAALGVCSGLCADTVDESAVAAAVATACAHLRHFSPGVEAAADEPGTFWLDTRGLTPLHRSLEEWAAAVLLGLQQISLEGAIAIGFRRFATCVLARASRTGAIALFERIEDEQAALLRVSIEHTGLDAAACAELAKLSVRSIGDFAALPTSGVRQRFGAGVERVLRQARGDLVEPLTRTPEAIAPHAALDLEFPETDRTRLVAILDALLEPLLASLAQRGQGVRTLALALVLDDARTLEEELSPAEPTHDKAWLLRLCELRLEGLRIAPGIVRVGVTLHVTPLRSAQQALFVEKPRRDPAAAAKAIDALQAIFGAHAVVRAQLCAAHLPEGSFRWQTVARERTHDAPIDRDGSLARAAAPSRRTITPHCAALVRRIFHAPQALAPLVPGASDGWLLRGVTHGCVRRLIGPYLLSGGWWRCEVAREYHFAQLQNGELFWIYYDTSRRRWYLQGSVS